MTPQFESPYFAAVDLGSNSFHMLIARVIDGSIDIIDREKEMVQIARGLQPNGMLDDEAQQRALHCLEKFSERLRDIPAAQIRAVGTRTLRDAANSDVFLKQAERALGTKIQIISGYEEARLIYSGLAHTVTKSDQRLVIDIGGGSTEFVIGQGFEPICLESLALGCVSFSEQYIAHSGGVTEANMKKIYYIACAELDEIRRNYIKTGWQVAYGTSGTMKSVAEILANQDGGAVITKTSLNQLINETIAEGKIASSNVTKLRKDVLPAGLAIIQAIFDQLQLESIQVVNATLKEGLIYDTIGRLSDHDFREDTVKKMVSTYHIDTVQADRVTAAALYFWSQFSSPALPGVSRTKVLKWAAQLHEIGLGISHSGFHHHGYYILRHGDLAGFGRYEQYILANLVRGHRKKLQEDRIEGLDAVAREAFVPLLVCLRVAVMLCRRREQVDNLPKIAEQNGIYTLSFTKDWLDEHPLTRASLEQEQTYLANIGATLKVEVSDTQ